MRPIKQISWRRSSALAKADVGKYYLLDNNIQPELQVIKIIEKYSEYCLVSIIDITDNSEIRKALLKYRKGDTEAYTFIEEVSNIIRSNKLNNLLGE